MGSDIDIIIKVWGEFHVFLLAYFRAHLHYLYWRLNFWFTTYLFCHMCHMPDLYFATELEIPRTVSIFMTLMDV